MQLVMFVTTRIEKIDELMQNLAKISVRGATVLESTGMAKSLRTMEGLEMFGALASVLAQESSFNSKTILCAVSDEKVEEIRKAIYEVFGDLSKPNTGIMLALPISFSDGIVKDK